MLPNVTLFDKDEETHFSPSSVNLHQTALRYITENSHLNCTEIELFFFLLRLFSLHFFFRLFFFFLPFLLYFVHSVSGHDH